MPKIKEEIKRVTRETEKAYAIELLDGRKDWIPKKHSTVEKSGKKTYLLCEEWSWNAKFGPEGTNKLADPTNPKAVDKSKSMAEELFPKEVREIKPSKARKLVGPSLEEFVASKTDDLVIKSVDATPEQKIYVKQVIEVLRNCIKDLESLD